MGMILAPEVVELLKNYVFTQALFEENKDEFKEMFKTTVIRVTPSNPTDIRISGGLKAIYIYIYIYIYI